MSNSPLARLWNQVVKLTKTAQDHATAISRLEASIEHLTEKVNRAEANAAHAKPVAEAPSASRVDAAMALLDRATEVFAAQTAEFERMKAALKNGR